MWSENRRQCAIRVALTLLAATALYAQPVLFVQQQPISVGPKPGPLAIADFDGDGIPDLLVVTQGSSMFSVLRNLGNTFFIPLATEDTGISPRAVAVGDFNRDGKLDVAVANFASNSVSIFLGNGNGTFIAPTSLPATGPSAIAVADFNADGNLDLAVVNTNSNTVSLFLGTGIGTFVNVFTGTVGQRPGFIAVADFNADGRLDLAVANANTNDVSILLGNGNGTFQTARSFAAGHQPGYIALADFNGDGNIDLALVNATGFATGTVSILLGFGNGAFQSPLTLTVGANATFLVAGDFNLDGIADLAVANTGGNTISIFSGVGNGTFLLPLDFTVGSAPAWIAVTDLNADGRPDLLVSNSLSNSISELINQSPVPSRPVVSSVLSAASFEKRAIAPGEVVSIFGSGLGPNPSAGAQLNATGLLETTLAQTRVLFDGIPSPLLSAGAGQVSAIVPFALAGRATTQLVVVNGGQTSSPMSFDVAPSAPALFAMDGSGHGQAMVLNQDGSVNSVAHPAAPGSVVVFYATGAGETSPPGVDGLVATGILPAPVLPVSVSVDSAPALVLYAGAEPGAVAGVMQLNVLLPSKIRSGTIPVTLQVGSAVSQTGITLTVQ